LPSARSRFSLLWLLVASGLAGCSIPWPDQPAAEPRVEGGAADPARDVALAEQRAALASPADVENGRRLYQTCASCHLPTGTGARDGTMPQLAGQHASVLIKQLTEIRAGVRTNPIMYPYVAQLNGPEGLRDVAAYLQSLPIPTDNGRGPGTDLGRGRRLYERDCARCHGRYGEGNAQFFYPVLAGQHYRYMLRQVIDIAKGRRGNANPEMTEVLESYSAGDISLVSDYASRLGRPPEGRGD
jgi:cytochrome c553